MCLLPNWQEAGGWGEEGERGRWVLGRHEDNPDPGTVDGDLSLCAGWGWLVLARGSFEPTPPWDRED